MSRNRCFLYKEQYYDVGTKVKIKTRWHGEVVATFLGYDEFDNVLKYEIPVGAQIENYIVEIIEPVYYQGSKPNAYKKSSIFTRTGSGSASSSDDVFHGLLLYIAVMLGGIIFNDRWLIWIAATVIFFGWKAKK